MTEILRKRLLLLFALLTVGSIYFAFQLKFSFDFEQFFPVGDPDLEFFLEFREKFETDDNFLMVALPGDPNVFNQDYLERLHGLKIASRRLPSVTETVTITSISYPVNIPLLGYTTVPAVHRNDPAKYESDSLRLVQDPRFRGSLLSEDGKTAVLFIKTVDNLEQAAAEALMPALRDSISAYGFTEYHMLGRAYFQDELVSMQKQEMLMSTLVSGLLVTLIMFLIFRRFWGIVISLTSIALGMILFLGLLGLLGRELNAMAALYPVLMIIVGTSDVIHIMSKYIDELRYGREKQQAIRITIREIGLATFLTSITTAIGFSTLLASRIPPIKDFGLNAALGVLVAYLTVLGFTTALLSWFPVDKIIKLGKTQNFWDKQLSALNAFTKNQPGKILAGGLVLLATCLIGISMISTNYRIETNLPRGSKIAEDFRYFETAFSGFRPFEVAVSLRDSTRSLKEPMLVREVGKLESHLESIPVVNSAMSYTSVYKSLNQANNGNRREAYVIPDSDRKIEEFSELADRFPQRMNVLLSEDQKHARIAARIYDLGADSIRVVSKDLDRWIASELDTSLLSFRQTGTGVIIDKNSEYVRDSLLKGLGFAIVIVGILMAFLFRNWKMVLISIIPNILPMLIAGAMLGYAGIELEAGISIVFAVVFGIAVDDTIHFLSKFKLALGKGLTVDDAIEQTFRETGKAIALTSIVLFFGFMILLFSAHPPSMYVGLLISVTLFSALFADLLFIPGLLRRFIKDPQ